MDILCKWALERRRGLRNCNGIPHLNALDGSGRSHGLYAIACRLIADTKLRVLYLPDITQLAHYENLGKEVVAAFWDINDPNLIQEMRDVKPDARSFCLTLEKCAEWYRTHRPDHQTYLVADLPRGYDWEAKAVESNDMFFYAMLKIPGITWSE